ncbi:MAG TPA: pyridoxal phosphate-dependent aminotransferase [Candidatus Sulfotelmatobacter sp.]|nr:pyridoxal phosphate-dependent aminotransferase [Candidatus Sulfotelmatobacter sp.]
MRLSQRARNLVPSATLAISAKARQMRAEEIDVLSFAAGEPDFDTPAHIKEVGLQAIRDGFTKYTTNAGIDELRDAVAAKLKRDNGLSYARNQILISCGGKHSIYNVFQALVGPGDEVLVPAPYWVSFPEQVKLCEATPVIVPTAERDGFRVNRRVLEPHVTPRARLLVLNSPSNPSGAALNREELEGIAALARERDFLIMADETYEALVYDGFQHVSVASLGEDAYRRTVLVNSMSKAYAMTGWRIGYTAAAPEIITAMDGLQSQMTSNPSSISQKAAAVALTGTQEPTRQMRDEFAKRRRLILDRLTSMPGVTCGRPEGAFYVFPNVSALFGKRGGGKVVTNSTEFSAYLLEAARIAVVPGVEFGSDAHIRISYATSTANIEQGMARMAEAVKAMA